MIFYISLKEVDNKLSTISILSEKGNKRIYGIINSDNITEEYTFNKLTVISGKFENVMSKISSFFNSIKSEDGIDNTHLISSLPREFYEKYISSYINSNGISVYDFENAIDFPDTLKEYSESCLCDIFKMSYVCNEIIGVPSPYSFTDFTNDMKYINNLNKNEDSISAMLKYYDKTILKAIAIEEMSELTKTITKDIRGNTNLSNIIEEMADVSICLDLLKGIYHISDDELALERSKKEERNLTRVANFIEGLAN